MGYIREREGTTIEIIQFTSMCNGPSGAILKFGGEWN